MRAAAKMLMITNARGNQGGNRRGRSEMDMGYGEMRGIYRDGQNEARNGGYGEMHHGYGRSEMKMDGYNRSEMNGEGGNMRGAGNDIGYEDGDSSRSEIDNMESRRRYRRDSRGRFRSEMEGGAGGEMHYPSAVPPIYEDYNQPRQIGFSAYGGEQKDGLHMIRGGMNQQNMALDEETAHEWMQNLQNEDGTTGPHWTKEQTNQVMKQKGIDCNPLEFWVAMNAVYSDYFQVAKKHNVNNVDFYAGMAKAFISDKDSQPNRLARYYEYIAKH